MAPIINYKPDVSPESKPLAGTHFPIDMISSSIILYDYLLK